MSTERGLLAIYLNDHLAAATGARELVRRAAGSNRGTELGSFLERLSTEVEQDRQSLLGVIEALGLDVDRLKVAFGWGAEKLGRLKLNGRVFGYSPLSRVVELEGLLLGVHGKLGLWRALVELRGQQPELAEKLGGVDLGALAARAERQLAGLEEHRLAAVRRL